MTTITFDTHEFVKKLKGVGFSEEQAELITDLQKTTAASAIEQVRHDYELDNLATKRDLKEMELGLEARLQRWIITVVFGVGVMQTAIIAALLLKLVK